MGQISNEMCIGQPEEASVFQDLPTKCFQLFLLLTTQHSTKMGLFLEARGEGSNTDTERGCCPASLSQLLGEGLCLS